MIKLPKFFAVAVCIVAALTYGASAAVISWGTPRLISADTDVQANGVLVEALCFGAATTVNGVPFSTGTALFPGLPNTYSGFASNATGLSSAYQTLLGGGLWGTTSPGTITLGSLYAGQTYQIQLWVNDSRSSGANRNETVTGSTNAVLTYNNTNATGGLGQYVIGTFTADAATQTITLQGNASTQINALSLRLVVGPCLTFIQRQQTLLTAARATFSSDVASPWQQTFWIAEAYFQNGQTSQGLQLVQAILSRLDSGGWNEAGELQTMCSGMDCYIKYGALWDGTTQSTFENYYTTYTGYQGQSTSNLTMLAAVTRYLGGQVWGESAFSANAIYSSDDPTGVNLITGRLASEAAEGMAEFGSRVYTIYNAFPVEILAQDCTNPTIANQAAITYELWLAQSAGTWVSGNWAISTARSYPDVLTQAPAGSAEALWVYFGGLMYDYTSSNNGLGAAVLGYQPPVAIENAATSRTQNYIAESSFGGDGGSYQYTYVQGDNYELFSQAVAPGVGDPGPGLSQRRDVDGSQLLARQFPLGNRSRRKHARSNGAAHSRHQWHHGAVAAKRGNFCDGANQYALSRYLSLSAGLHPGQLSSLDQ